MTQEELRALRTGISTESVTIIEPKKQFTSIGDEIYVNENGDLSGGAYQHIAHQRGSNSVELDGSFSAADLRIIAAYMETFGNGS